MRVPHVLVDAAGTVEPSTLHHLRRVLRLRPGATLSCTDGAGRLADGVLTAEGVRVGPWSEPAPAPLVTLYAAVSKGAKLDLVVEKATELGVRSVVPVVCERSERRPEPARVASRSERWRKIARAALEQSRGSWLPDIPCPVRFEEIVDVPAGTTAALLEPGGAGGAAGLLALAPTRVAVGPEGGFSPSEVAAAEAGGWVAVGLGPRVLRTETAAIVAAALAVAATGGLQDGSSDPG